MKQLTFKIADYKILPDFRRFSLKPSTQVSISIQFLKRLSISVLVR